MKREYESIVKNVCRLNSWSGSNQEERDGAVGVACVLAFMKGIKPTVRDLSDNIGVDMQFVEEPFTRLFNYGVFENRYNAREDDVLRGKAKDKVVTNEIVFTAAEQTKSAWAILAGIASGVTGPR
jgi:hypothetical protein